MPFHPYLFFADECRQAFERYRDIFGGELWIMTADEAPPSEEMPPGDPDMVLHASLTFGDALLMGSDDPFATEKQPARGICVNYSTDDPEEAARVHGELAEGGEVTMPFGETFFSPAFGMCVDRFGISWMVSTDPVQTE